MTEQSGSFYGADVPSYQGPGVYQHYKGNYYLVLGLALREDVCDEEGNYAVSVVYMPLYGSPQQQAEAVFWSRLLTSFNSYVQFGDDGHTIYRRRFAKVR